MEFDWRKAIDRCCEGLGEVAAGLVVLAGIHAGRKVETLPRHLYLRILSMLRPAEFAARRLIAMAACKLFPMTLQAGEAGESRPKNAVIREPEPSTRSRDSPAPSKSGTNEPFATVDGRLVAPRMKPADVSRLRGLRKAAHPTRPAFALFDPFKPAGDPWLKPGEVAWTDGFPELRFSLPPNEPVDAVALCRRVRALADALADLDWQALRLARWRARRALANTRPRRWSPLRPGLPPGHSNKPKTEIEDLLRETHYLACEAWNTS